MSLSPEDEPLAILVGGLADTDPVRRKQSRDELIALHMPLVEHLARKFQGRGEPIDDLTQVGMLGLVKAVDRFDPHRGVTLAAFATPTVLGEIKRHFRDKGWAIRVPRQVQELRIALAPATEDLTHELKRSPTVPELAERLGVSDEELLEAIESSYAYRTDSLDVLADDEGPTVDVGSQLGVSDRALEAVDDRESLKPLLAELSDREKLIIDMRFFRGMTQSAIATELGISQMHVSRLIARTLEQLRRGLVGHQGDPAGIDGQ